MAVSNASIFLYYLLKVHQTPRGAKRRRSVTPPPGSSPPGPSRVQPDEESSLPPSSPPAPFSDTDESLDERDAVRDVNDDADEDEDGDDLFAEDFQEYVGPLFLVSIPHFRPVPSYCTQDLSCPYPFLVYYQCLSFIPSERSLTVLPVTMLPTSS